MAQMVTRQQPPDSTLSSLLRQLALDVALPWITIQRLDRLWAVPTVPAFAAAAVFPAASIVLSWTRRRRPDYIGLAVLITILTGIAVALLTDDVRFAVLKAAPAFGLFGVACLVSLWRPRPLMFFVGREFTAGDDKVRRAAWTARLETAGFRQAMRLLTFVWGIACVLEATLGIGAALLLPPRAALVAEAVLGIGTVAALLLWTTAFARRRAQRASDQEGAEPARA